MTVIATLTVSRPAGSWTDRLRPHRPVDLLDLLVDDEPRGRLAAGKSVSLALAPGRHRVRAGGGEEIEVHLGPGGEERLILDGTTLRAES